MSPGNTLESCLRVNRKGTENREGKETSLRNYKAGWPPAYRSTRKCICNMDGQKLSSVSFVWGTSKPAVPNTEEDTHILESGEPSFIPSFSRVVCSQSAITSTQQNQQAPHEERGAEADQPILQMIRPSGISLEMILFTIFEGKMHFKRKIRKHCRRFVKEPAVTSGNENKKHFRKSCMTDLYGGEERIGGLDDQSEELPRTKQGEAFSPFLQAHRVLLVIPENRQSYSWRNNTIEISLEIS